MKASELRIGNWIYISEKGEYQVDCPHDLEELWDRDMVDCCGIVLTEEWLLKFGYSLQYEANDCKYFSINNKTLMILRMDNFGKSKPRFIMLESRCFFFNFCETEYVHQFQNDHYTFFREELTIKEQI